MKTLYKIGLCIIIFWAVVFARDSFISTWRIPVDVGRQKITYRFPLEPNYRYKIKVVAYHEASGQWREWVRIDEGPKHQIKYNPYQPKTLEFWVPPAFYRDGTIDVVFERITGAFATAGPIYIYRYEYEEGEGGGPMAQETQLLSGSAITVFPNPFKERLIINLNSTGGLLTTDFSPLSVSIYDVAGRLIKRFNHLTNSPFNQFVWNGNDEYGMKVPPGVYFLRIQNSETKEALSHKVIKLR